MFMTLYLKRLGKISFKTNYCNQGSSFEEREWKLTLNTIKTSEFTVKEQIEVSG